MPNITVSRVPVPGTVPGTRYQWWYHIIYSEYIQKTQNIINTYYNLRAHFSWQKIVRHVVILLQDSKLKATQSFPSIEQSKASNHWTYHRHGKNYHFYRRRCALQDHSKWTRTLVAAVHWDFIDRLSVLPQRLKGDDLQNVSATGFL